MAMHFPQVVVFLMLLNMATNVQPLDVLRVFRARSLVVRTAVSVLVLVPLFALGLTFIDAIPHETQVALALLAAAPGAPLASQRAAGLGSPLASAMALQLIVANLGVVTAPLTILAIARLHGFDLHLPMVPLAQQLFVVQGAPLLLGAVLRFVAPAFTQRINKPLSRVANLAMLAMGLMLIDALFPFLRGLDGASWLALMGFSAFALTVGHALGGPEASTRRAVAICSANRNLGLAVMLGAMVGQAGVGIAGKHAPPYIMAFAVVNFLVSTVYGVLSRRDRGDASAPASA